jgi:SAM-dependent methyltransferase
MQWLVDNFVPFLRGQIVEVGIGHGHYAPILSRYGSYLGIDHDPDSIARATAAFPNCSFAKCDISKVQELRDVIPTRADAIVSINVMEHIEDDRAAISNLVEVIKPGGHLLLSVPALMLLYNDLDRLAGHCRRYSLEMMRSRLDGLPLETVRLCYFNPIGGMGWWLNSLKRRQSLNDNAVNAQIRLFDRYVLPVSRALDPVFRPFFGQSVTCIARRR